LRSRKTQRSRRKGKGPKKKEGTICGHNRGGRNSVVPLWGVAGEDPTGWSANERTRKGKLVTRRWTSAETKRTQKTRRKALTKHTLGLIRKEKKIPQKTAGRKE